MKRLAALIFWFALVYSAHAQSVQQSGTVTPTHLGAWTTSGVLQDAGTAAQPFASTGGVSPGPWCVNSGPVTGPYQAFCLNANTSTGGVLSIQNFGGASAGGISFNINGTPTTFPTVITPTTNGDVACFNNTTGTLIDCGSPPISTLSHTHILVGNGSNIAIDFGALATFSDGGTLSLNPTTPGANVNNQGFFVTQTGPPSFATGPLIFNGALITNTASVTLPATLTNGQSNNQVHGLEIELHDSAASTITSVISAHYVAIGTTGGDKIALHSNAYTNQTSTGGYLLGGDFVAAVDTGSSGSTLVSTQHECPLYGTGSAVNRYCIEITNSHNGVGEASTIDAALVIDNNGTVGGAFIKGIEFGSPNDAAVPIAASGDAVYFHNNHSATITNFVNATNLTVTGDIFLFPNFTVQNTNNQNGSTQIDIDNNNAGTATYIQYRANNGANVATFGIGGTGATPALYAGRGYATSNSSLIVGTTTSNALRFIMNNAEVGEWTTTAGQLTAGLAGTTIGNFCIANATSGTICLAPPTGALGSAVLTLPDITDTLAGLTAPTFVTSITSPIVYGGSAAGAALQLVSTSNGSPSGDVVLIKQGGNVLVTLKGGNMGFGTEINPLAPFIFSRSATTGQGGFIGSTTQFQFIGADSVANNVALLSYNASNSFFFYEAGGTAAIPTATSSGAVIGTFGWGGYNGTVFKFPTRVISNAAETFTGSVNGAYVEIDATPTGSSTRAQAMRIQAGVIIGAGTTDPGANNLIIGGVITVSGITTDATHTDATVCEDTTTHQFYFGSGAAGICLGTSSLRFKHDVAPLRAGLDQIMALQPVSYRLNADHGDPKQLLYGFTAEQGGTVLPDLMHRDVEGRPNTFDYLGVVPVLVRAIQEQQTEIIDLKRRLH